MNAVQDWFPDTVSGSCPTGKVPTIIAKALLAKNAAARSLNVANGMVSGSRNIKSMMTRLVPQTI